MFLDSQFTLEMIQTNPNTPRSYKLNMSKDVAPMCVFSKSNQGKISVEGKVECNFDMEPQNLRAYSNLCRDRTNEAAVLENDHGMFMRPMPGIVVGQLPSSSKEKRKLTQSKRQDAKRVRMDKGEMLNILFRLFERQPNWRLKQLVLETDQPQQFLKEMLREICVYNKRGSNQGTHELKGEYKIFGGNQQ
ncbi:hypothetical protein ZIOFF_004468 [Zingiber officinale]|uniref:TFIIF beta subunit HTH domain-containing protein n=1 Tax=Zingiber officinale TaxID=94328 RepID=A0A8J5IAF2_ZINOF|nr:hypothetical protein ZIOFF_004468 [Zingiber officinale]